MRANVYKQRPNESRSNFVSTVISADFQYYKSIRVRVFKYFLSINIGTYFKYFYKMYCNKILYIFLNTVVKFKLYAFCIVHIKNEYLHRQFI